MTAVISASASTTRLHHQAGGPRRSKAMRTNAYTATLVITPLISAETWLGAAGWASGSQTWSGDEAGLRPVGEERQREHQTGRA